VQISVKHPPCDDGDYDDDDDDDNDDVSTRPVMMGDDISV
jgi:hypothetical protein